MLTFALRAAELGPSGSLVDDGATIAAAGTSHALYGTTWFGEFGDLGWSAGTTDRIGVTAPLTLGESRRAGRVAASRPRRAAVRSHP